MAGEAAAAAGGEDAQGQGGGGVVDPAFRKHIRQNKEPQSDQNA